MNHVVDLLKQSQSNRSGFETLVLLLMALLHLRLNPTVVVLKHDIAMFNERLGKVSIQP